MDCCLCNNEIAPQHFPNGNIWFHGNNAEPVKEGRCCTSCSESIVVDERYKAFDIGVVVYKGREIKPDGLELKRQIMLSEGDSGICEEGICIGSDEMKNAVIDGDVKAIKEAWLKAQQDVWITEERRRDNGD